MDFNFPAEFVWGVSDMTPLPVQSALTPAFDEGMKVDRNPREDAALTAELGADTYHISIAWARLFPAGGGKPVAGVRDRYDRYLDDLLGSGIQPWLRLDRASLPPRLQARGGWTNRDSVYYFADYADYAAEQFGDRARHLLVEPGAAALPGETLQHPLDREAALALRVHHLNLAAGLSIKRLRQLNRDWQLGTDLNLPSHFATNRDENEQTALDRTFTDPLLRGSYPEGVGELLEPHLQPDDLATVHTSLDFINLTVCSRVHEQTEPKADPDAQSAPATVSESLYAHLVELKETCDNPSVFITGSVLLGASARHPVKDLERVTYLARHLEAAHRALAAGAQVKGYAVRPLLDTERRERSGLVYLDDLQVPQRKVSFKWYQEVIRNKGFDLGRTA